MQWAIAALLAVVFFAPHWLPPMARHLAAGVRRYGGISSGFTRRRARHVQRAGNAPVTQIPTEKGKGSFASTPQEPTMSWRPIMGMALFVGAAILLLMWALLHTR